MWRILQLLFYIFIENENGRNKASIELRRVQFWSEIILVISNRTRAARSFDSQTAGMISDQIAIHSVQFPLLNVAGLSSRSAFCYDLTPNNFAFLLYLKPDHSDC